MHKMLDRMLDVVSNMYWKLVVGALIGVVLTISTNPPDTPPHIFTFVFSEDNEE